LAAELKRHLGVEAKLIPGSGGVFEVTAEGRLVFSKKTAGRFPDPSEIVEMLQKH